MAFDPDHSLGAAPSPCISICVLDEDSRMCLGCRRTIDEITTWSRLSEDAKRAVWRRLLEGYEPISPAPDAPRPQSD